MHESVPPMTCERIGNSFGLNGGTIFWHVTEELWTRRGVRQSPVLLADEIITLRSFLMDRFLQKKPASYADLNNFIFIQTGKSIPGDAIG
jgi:hypothetical protein